MASWVTDKDGRSIPLFNLDDLRPYVSEEVWTAINELIDPDEVKYLEMELDSYSEDIRVYRDCINEGVQVTHRLLNELFDRSKKINRGNLISGLRELRERLEGEL